MINDDLIARLQSLEASKPEILAILGSSKNHIILFNALLAAGTFNWDRSEPLVPLITALFDSPESEKRVAMGSTLRTLIVLALGKFQGSEASCEYKKLKNRLNVSELDSLEWLERKAPVNLVELFE